MCNDWPDSSGGSSASPPPSQSKRTFCNRGRLWRPRALKMWSWPKLRDMCSKLGYRHNNEIDIIMSCSIKCHMEWLIDVSQQGISWCTIQVLFKRCDVMFYYLKGSMRGLQRKGNPLSYHFRKYGSSRRKSNDVNTWAKKTVTRMDKKGISNHATYTTKNNGYR